MSFYIRDNDGESTVVPFFRPLSSLEVLDRLSKEVWDSWRPFTKGDAIVPQTDIFEEAGRLVVKTELPGVSAEDLDITLAGDTLTVTAERREDTPKNARHRAREMRYGQYFRSITLPYRVKEAEITATLNNGILELRLPKAEATKPRKVEIKGQVSKRQAKTRQVKTTKTEK